LSRDPRDEARAAFERGDLAAAESALHRACKERGHADDWLTLGRLELAGGREADARRSIQQAHIADPSRPDIARLFLRVAFRTGALAEARAALEAAAAAHPEDAELLAELGDVCDRLADRDAARAAFDAALNADPAHDVARFNRAAIARDEGRFADALADYDVLVAAKPDASPDVLVGRAEALRRLERYDEARADLEAALARAPDRVDALMCLGVVEAMRWALDAAQAAFDRACHLDAEAVARYAGRAPDRIDRPSAAAVVAYERLEALRRADWSDYDASAARFCAFFPDDAADGPSALEFAFLTMYLDVPLIVSGRAHASISRAVVAQTPRLPPPGPRATRGRIRVAYASNCFRNHPKMYLTGHLFESHDRDTFEVVAYDYGEQPEDDIGARIRSEFDAFAKVGGLTDDAIARRIRADDIDLLIDLNGYSDDVRPGIFAARPARVELSFLGHMHSLFAPFIDYRVSSRSAEPLDWRLPLHERRVFLPGSFYPYDVARLDLPDPGSRADAGLPDDAFVFCAFSRMEKISPATFRAWLAILAAVPDSVLWLTEFSPPARDHLAARARAAGIAADRLVFAPLVDHDTHVARHLLADLYLDTFRFNAHTMGLDALHAGLPVVTLAGEPWCARIGASFLTALGLTELVADDAQAYVQVAIRLATDQSALADVRTRLAARIAYDNPFDSRRVAGLLDRAYVAIFETWQSGRAFEDLDVVG